MDCPKCKQAMQEGFLPDFGDGATARQSVWTEGKPVQGRFGGLFGLRMRGKAQVPIASYRCASCGFLEFYAK